MALRLAFMGTPDFAVPALDALATAGHEIVCVYTQPPRPSGRGHKVQPSAVQQRAEALRILIRHPISLKSPEEQQAFSDLKLDGAVVAAYGLILPRPILAAPRLGCINIHGSLLPRWRGAAPIQRAILADDRESGITIMQMESGLDTGPMLLWESVPITAATTASTLHDSLSALGAKLIVPAMEQLAAGRLQPTAQPDTGVTYATKLDRGEGQLNWGRDAAYLERQARALNPAPGVWFEHEGERIKVLAAASKSTVHSEKPGTVLDDTLTIACGDGVFIPAKLQRPGRQALDLTAFLHGMPIAPGTKLPCPAIG